MKTRILQPVKLRLKFLRSRFSILRHRFHSRLTSMLRLVKRRVCATVTSIFAAPNLLASCACVLMLTARPATCLLMTATLRLKPPLLPVQHPKVPVTSWFLHVWHPVLGMRCRSHPSYSNSSCRWAALRSTTRLLDATAMRTSVRTVSLSSLSSILRHPS